MPISLVFRLENNCFMGFDSIRNIDYEIRWCGNDQYSHYWLYSNENSFYVYVWNNDSNLLKEIHEAELRLVFKTT